MVKLVRFGLLLIALLLLFPVTFAPAQVTYSPLFDGESAYTHLVNQCDFGPRPPGSENLSRCREYIVNNLESLGWDVTLQNFTHLGVACSNIIASWPVQNSSIIILVIWPTSSTPPVPRGNPKVSW